MTLVSTASLTAAAVERGGAILAFNVITLEHAEAIATAAEAVGRPAILQISHNAVRFHDALLPIARATAAVAEISSAPLAPHLDQIYLFSGDGDFRPLVEAVQRKGVKVSVVSTISTNPPMVSDELRRQCDEFVELAQLMQKVGRDPAERSARASAVGPAAGNPSLERRYGIRQGDEPVEG